MDEQTTVMLVAIIGVGSSLLSFSLASYINAKENDKKREWQKEDNAQRRAWELEDRKLERRLSVLDKRLIEARRYLSSSNNVCIGLFELEYTLINFSKPSNFLYMLETFNSNYGEIHGRNSVIFSLNDHQLNELNQELSNLLITEQPNLARLNDAYSNNHTVDRQKENERVGEFMGSSHRLQILIQKRLDELSGFDN
jgi:hypothetical protein